jgi:hypothetical protein
MKLLNRIPSTILLAATPASYLAFMAVGSVYLIGEVENILIVYPIVGLLAVMVACPMMLFMRHFHMSLEWSVIATIPTLLIVGVVAHSAIYGDLWQNALMLLESPFTIFAPIVGGIIMGRKAQ